MDAIVLRAALLTNPYSRCQRSQEQPWARIPVEADWPPACFEERPRITPGVWNVSPLVFYLTLFANRIGAVAWTGRRLTRIRYLAAGIVGTDEAWLE